MKKQVYFAIAAIVMVSLACSINLGGTGSSGQTSNVLFQDDFSKTNSGWPSKDGSDHMGYKDGAFQIYLDTSLTDLIANPDQSFPADVIVETDVINAGSTDNNDFGVVCRLQDLDNFYFFEAASDGYAVIGMFKDNEMKYLSADRMLAVDGINPGSTLNHVRAECIGSSLKLYVNGKLVAETTDTTFTSGGDAGLIAGSFDVGGVDLRFDNFVVTKP